MNKQLQHIATALLLLVLIGAGKAWGQTTLYTCASNGDWSNAAIWFTDATCTTPHGSIPGDNPVVIISGANIVSGIALSPLKQVTIQSGATLAVSGNFNPSEAPLVSGTLTVSGSMTISGGSTKTIIATGGTITVTGAVSFPVEMTINGSLNVGTTFTGKRINTGSSSSIVVGGNYTVDAPSTFNGYAKIGGSYSGTEITSGATSTVVIIGNVTTNGTVNISGDFLVSGNYTMNGGTMTVLNGGAVVVGGDFDRKNNNFNVNGGGYAAVYGDFSATGGNSTITAPGELVVVGTVTGCPTCTDNIINSDDPVWGINEGWRSLYWEDFSTNTGTSHAWDGFSCWTLTSPATITTNRISFTAPSRNSYTLWESCEISTGCYTELTISAYVTGTGSGSAILQYSRYIGGVWTPWDYNNQNAISVANATTGFRQNDDPITASRVKIRLIALDVLSGNTIFMDNISISGTKGFGAELPPIELLTDFNELTVCENETYTYQLDEDYETYLWEVSPGSTLNSAPNSSYAQIQWAAGTGRWFKVTVSNECGLSESRTFDISDLEGAFKVMLVNKTDLICASVNTGAISVKGFCGTNNYSYSWSGPDGYTATGATINNLAPGDYTVICTDIGTSAVDSKTYTIESPTEINIVLKSTSITTSCDPGFGCNGTLEFEISGPANHVLVVELDTDLAGFTPSNTVRMDFTSQHNQTDYQYEVTISRARFPGIQPDFSDVRFFSDAALTNQLYYWLMEIDGSEATYLIKTNIVNGNNSIYMVYGSHSYPSYDSPTSVLDQGSMAVQVYNNPNYSGTATTCNDSRTSFTTIANGASICTSTLSGNKSYIFSGWYLTPNEDFFKLRGKTSVPFVTSNLYINGILVSGSSNGNSSFHKSYDLPPTYRNAFVFLEFYFSVPSGAETEGIGAVFSGNKGTYTSQNTDINFSNAYSRKYLSPQPSPPVFVESYVYTGLCPGDYDLTVTDISVTPNCVATETFTIDADTDSPTFATFPADYSGDITEAGPVANQTIFYESFIDALGSGWTLSPSTYFENRNRDLKFEIPGTTRITATATRTVSTVGFSDIVVSLLAYQSAANGGNGWESGDYIQIHWSPNGTTGWTELVIDREVWQGDNFTENFNLPNDGNTGGATFESNPITGTAENNENFTIRITLTVDQPYKIYYLSTLTVTGTIDDSVEPVTSNGSPTAFDGGDITKPITPYYIDVVNVDNSCGGGIQILRTWTITDNCGKSDSRVQNITLYDPNFAPAFATVSGPPASLSFCNNLVENLTLPTAAASTCEPYQIYWSIDGGTTMNLVYESDNPSGAITPDVTFPANATTTFSWILVDQILATAQEDYSVTVGPEITATFSYNPSFLAPEVGPNICEGDGVTVTVNAQGGSGTFTRYDFTTTTGSASLPNDADGVWPSVTTIQNNDQIIVEITDSGGCSTSDRAVPNNGPITAPEVFTVHQGITTNPIQTAP